MKIRALLDELVRRDGTDLYVVPGRSAAHARVGGVLVPLDQVSLAAIETTLNDMLAPRLRARLTVEREVMFALTVGSERFRACVFHAEGGLSAAFRRIVGRAPPLDFTAGFLDARAGLVLATGPAGTGKTTTVASLAERLATARACHVTTLEEPLEVLLSPTAGIVTQREVGTEVPSFSAGLRNVCRADADVVVVSDVAAPGVLAVIPDLVAAGFLVVGAITSPARSLDLPPAVQRSLVGVIDHDLERRRRVLEGLALTSPA